MTTTPERWRKRPVEIEAMRYDGENWTEIAEWLREHDVRIGRTSTGRASIPTLEGTMYASPSDYIIRGVQGEFYPCKPDIFERTYMRAGLLGGDPTGDAVERGAAVLYEATDEYVHYTWGEFADEYPVRAAALRHEAARVLAAGGETRDIQHCWREDGSTWCGEVVEPRFPETVEEARIPVCANCHRRVMHHRSDAVKMLQQKVTELAARAAGVVPQKSSRETPDAD